MKKNLLILIATFFVVELNAQVIGVSADKLVAINPLSIPKGTVEFEPAFCYLWTSSNFNINGKTVPLSESNDSITNLKALAFRTTYGFAKDFEIGVMISSDLSTFSAGIKYTFFQTSNSAGAFLAGTTFSDESDIVFRNSGFFGKTCSLSTGIAFTNVLSNKFELDYDIQYQNLFTTTGSEADDYFANADVSFKIKNGLRVVSGLSGRFNHDKAEMLNAYSLTVNSGLIISPGETFILVLNIPVDIAGRNIEKYTGFSMALTVFLD